MGLNFLLARLSRALTTEIYGFSFGPWERCQFEWRLVGRWLALWGSLVRAVWDQTWSLRPSWREFRKAVFAGHPLQVHIEPPDPEPPQAGETRQPFRTSLRVLSPEARATAPDLPKKRDSGTDPFAKLTWH
jgi:hypothetical protein